MNKYWLSGITFVVGVAVSVGALHFYPLSQAHRNIASVPHPSTSSKYVLDHVADGTCIKQLLVFHGDDPSFYAVTGYAPSTVGAISFINVGQTYREVKYEKSAHGFIRTFHNKPTWTYAFGDGGERRFLVDEIRHPRSEKSVWEFSDDGKELTITVISENPSPLWKTPPKSVCKYSLDNIKSADIYELEDAALNLDQTLVVR